MDEQGPSLCRSGLEGDTTQWHLGHALGRKAGNEAGSPHGNVLCAIRSAAA